MLNYLRIICLLTGFTYLLSVCAGGVSVTTCPHAKTNVLACERTLTELVNARLAPFGKAFSTIDFDNTTESELLDEQTRNVVCSKANTDYVSCVVSNVTACPDLAGDSDIISTWIASLIAEHLDILDSPQRVCEFFQDSVCSFREIKLNTCYNAILGKAVIENTNVNMCVSGKSDYLTCMIEVYKECKPYLNLTDNQNIASNIKVLMVEDQWQTFSSGSEMCDCYEAKACFSELIQDISGSINPAKSVRDSYQNTVALAETLCSNVTRVRCAQKGKSQTCKNVLQNHNVSSVEISVFNAAVDSIYDIVNTDDFQKSKECITDKLADSYHPCMEKAKLPTPINSCRDLKKLYSCVRDALKGQCNGEYINTAYEMIRVQLKNTVACNVTSSAALSYTISVTLLLLMSILFFYVF